MAVVVDNAAIQAVQISVWKKAFISLKGAPLIPLFIIVVFILSAILADLITFHDAHKVSLPNRLIPPFWQDGGTFSHPLGTDPLGRDVLTRIIYGTRVSVIIAGAALTIGGGFGTLVGLTAGFYGGKVDTLLMRLADITLAFPLILFAILLVMVIGPSMMNVIVAISLVLWARYARVIRGEVLGLMQRDFIARARVSGASDWRIMMRHLLPNVMPTLIVLLTLQVGWVIIVEASLSFLGAGIPPPTPAWGSMLADGREYVSTAWWVTTAPGIAIMLVVLAFNLSGDWLRERLDPKQRSI
ncbi:MAG: ABC transporter permease [Chloroflexota bacterium]|jgi:peptide/nickel transport system permease protein|nr:ABC transporter permease [Dehalococcoidia bacterium]MEC9012957.1 ABC transporter permease [Chloroflexota bacterium]MEE3014482.1 ABC transporter permease [Chloroflexota bacterium]GIS93241.1 MAG: peptide ABC transporter permease [Dehalococcoidia bacterium]|tara:strand:+ start:5140 stop:6036 length:897 start_codon:yes stop_codon:yes gene_type:complete